MKNASELIDIKIYLGAISKSKNLKAMKTLHLFNVSNHYFFVVIIQLTVVYASFLQ